MIIGKPLEMATILKSLHIADQFEHYSVLSLPRRRMKGIPESFAFTTILSNSEVTSSVSQGVDELWL